MCDKNKCAQCGAHQQAENTQFTQQMSLPSKGQWLTVRWRLCMQFKPFSISSELWGPKPTWLTCQQVERAPAFLIPFTHDTPTLMSSLICFTDSSQSLAHTSGIIQTHVQRNLDCELNRQRNTTHITSHHFRHLHARKASALHHAPLLRIANRKLQSQAI